MSRGNMTEASAPAQPGSTRQALQNQQGRQSRQGRQSQQVRQVRQPRRPSAPSQETTAQWWRRAADEGRLRPGRGPEYTRRVLPHRLPFLRQAALDSGVVSKHVLAKHYLTVAWGVLFLVLEPDTPRQVTGDSPGPFLVDIITRARAHWLRHRSAVISGWAAAAFHGLLYWSDSAQVVLLVTSTRTGRGRTRRASEKRLVPTFRTWPDCVPRETVTPDPRCPELRCVTAPVAAAQCLKSIFRKMHTWPVPDIPGLNDVQVRAVQFIDAYLQCTTVTVEEIVTACRGLVSLRRLAPVLPLIDYGAQSPRETLLRLVAGPHLPEGMQWSSQFRVDLPGSTWTVLDLACAELRIALYYDGADHRTETRNKQDIDQIQELKDLGWEVIRVDAGLFADRTRLLRLLDNAVARAAAENA